MMRFLWIGLSVVALSACSMLQNTADNDHAAVCKELKRRIVFNAATSDNTEATQQRAELYRLNKSYNAQGC